MEDSAIALFEAIDARFDRLDVVVNNASDTRAAQMAKDMDVVQMSAEIWDRAFQINARGTMFVATQYGKRGIRCNAVSPGLIVTANVRDNNPNDQLNRIESHNLTPCLGEPEDIAGAVAYLASDDGRFVTAQTIAVDGGITSHMPYFFDNIENFTASPGQRTV